MAERPQDGVYGVDFAQQEAIKLADAMQLELEVKTTDVLDQLVNNDFEGDFFTIGDTVKVVAIDPNSIKIVETDKNDMRPTLDGLVFSQNTMEINRQRQFAFQIKDLERLEDRWNHESAAHALAARKMRMAACTDILNLITGLDGQGRTRVATLGSVGTPVLDLTQITDAQKRGEAIFRLVNAMKEHLNKTGAVNGEEYKFGANKTVPMRGTASLFVAPAIHRELLNVQYVRVDDVTEDVIRDGKYEKFNGCLLNAAPELDSTYARHVDILNGAANIGIIILGTKNTVTRAGKVLPPEKMRDYVKFADNYYGREIYGRMIACPEACVIAFVKVNNEFTVNDAGAPGLFVQFPKDPITRNGVANVADNYPQLANKGYMNEAIPETYVTSDELTATLQSYTTDDELTATLQSYATDDELTEGLAGKVAQTDYATHVHGGVTAGEANTGVPVTPSPEPSDTDSDSDTDTDTDTDTDADPNP